MCQKVPYDSKKVADQDIKFIKNQSKHFTSRVRSNRKVGRKMTSYLCKYCGSWHITTSKSKRKY